MDVRVTTASGGLFIIRNATAFGPNGILGMLDSSPETLRVFHLADGDEVEEF